VDLQSNLNIFFYILLVSKIFVKFVKLMRLVLLESSRTNLPKIKSVLINLIRLKKIQNCQTKLGYCETLTFSRKTPKKVI